MEMLDWGRAVQHCGSAAPRHMKYIKWHFDGHSFLMVIRGWDLELASARSMRLDVIFRCSMKRWARHQSYHYIHHLLYNMMSKDKDWAYHIFPEQRLIIIIFDFLKVHNELGKVKKFWTSRPLFSWRNGLLKKVWAHCAPNKVNIIYLFILPWLHSCDNLFTILYAL